MSSWDNAVAKSVTRRAIVCNISILGSVLTQSLDKTMQIAILGIGALEVFSGNIPRSGQNPKILGRDDTEVIRYLITIDTPFSGHLLA
jgi:hypothetical protein